MKIVYTPGSLVQDLGVIQLHIGSSVKGPDSDKVRHSGPDAISALVKRDVSPQISYLKTIYDKTAYCQNKHL